MPIGVRFKQHGGRWLGTIIIACHYCAKDIENVAEGVTVWLAEPSDASEQYITIDYAHNVCEERFLLSSGSAESALVAKKANIPLDKFLSGRSTE